MTKKWKYYDELDTTYHYIREYKIPDDWRLWNTCLDC